MSVQRHLEAALGLNLDGIGVHTDGPAADLAAPLGANACAEGQDIYFGGGQYDPGRAGQHLIAHEVDHTVQQRRAGLFELLPLDKQNAVAMAIPAEGAGPIQLRTTAGADGVVESRVHEAAAAGIQGAGGPLPQRETIAAAFGRHSISDVQAHIGGAAEAACDAMGANAYATGAHVAFRGAPDLHTAAHEAAHVVQQRGGVQLEGGVGQSGDSYETHADRIADLVVAGKSAESALGAVASGGVAGVQRRDSVRLDSYLIGHASPRWEHTRGGSRAELNMELSQQRVDRVAELFSDIVDADMELYGLLADHQFECRAIDAPDDELCAESGASVDTDAYGHSMTEQEASGDAKANDASMRRVDVEVAVTRNTTTGEDRSVLVDIAHPAWCAPTATRLWELRIMLSGGGSHAGFGGGGGIIRLRRADYTKQQMDYAFVGAGSGIGVATPNVDMGWGDWVFFTTTEPATFADFDGTPISFSGGGAGFGLLSYTYSDLEIPQLADGTISTSGLGMGMIGGDISFNAGLMFATGALPERQCYAETSETVPMETVEEFHSQASKVYSHRILFDTQSAEPSAQQIEGLHAFVLDLVATESRQPQ